MLFRRSVRKSVRTVRKLIHALMPLPIYSALYKPIYSSLDYAVMMFHDALTKGHHDCYLREDTRLPMMYIDDCLRSIVEFLNVPEDKLKLRTYNLNAMSFTPAELAEAVKKHIPNFTISYKPDYRQEIGKQNLVISIVIVSFAFVVYETIYSGRE